MALGGRIIDLRKQRNMTQEDLAKALAVSRGAVSMWEIDQRTPDPATLQRLANYYNVSVDYLLGISDIPMSNYIQKRVMEICVYILDSHATAKITAQVFGVSENTVYKDMTERLPILNKNLADKVKKIWEIENLPSKKPSFDQEVQAFSLLRRTHPDIVELISKIAELPEDQQELVAGHWKWALEVVEKQQKKDESIAKEERTDYHANLDALLPRNEIGLGEALVKISEIAYLNELTEQDIMYLHKKAVEHYGVPVPPGRKGNIAALGPRSPGQIKLRNNGKDKTSTRKE